MPKASLVVLLLGLLLVVPPVLAQDAKDTPTTNDTPTDDAAAGNETEGGGQPDDGPPAPPEPVTLVLTGHGEGGQFYFEMDGRRNPRLTIAPGAEVTVTLRTVSGGVHNFCTDATGAKECTPIVSEGDEASVTFTAPESGTFEYWCDPHRSSGMRGQLVIGTAAAGEGGGDAGGEQEQFTGETVDLGDLGYPQCAGRKIPAASAQRAVGGPTIADYVRECETGGNSGPVARPKHPVDYVIPASWVLIGLGVAGVVWVHRSYRP